MSRMKELVDVKEARAKQAMKKGYDKKATKENLTKIAWFWSEPQTWREN